MNREYLASRMLEKLKSHSLAAWTRSDSDAIRVVESCVAELRSATELEPERVISLVGTVLFADPRELQQEDWTLMTFIPAECVSVAPVVSIAKKNF